MFYFIKLKQLSLLRSLNNSHCPSGRGGWTQRRFRNWQKLWGVAGGLVCFGMGALCRQTHEKTAGLRRRMSGRAGEGLYCSSGNEWLPDTVGDDIRIGGGVWLSNFG